MGFRAGFNKGTLFGHRVKSNDNYINNREWVSAAKINAETNTIASQGGTQAAMSGVVASGVALYSDLFVLNYTDASNIYSRFTFAVPSFIEGGEKVDLSLYWSTSGTTLGQAVVWDIDYAGISLAQSGVTAVSGLNYSISGINRTNVTSSGAIIQRISGVAYNASGSIQKTVLTIPKADVAANEYMSVILYRDGDETLDTLNAPATLLGVLIEYK